VTPWLYAQLGFNTLVTRTENKTQITVDFDEGGFSSCEQMWASYSSTNAA
jgi:hypothetical protein